jgi:hypothetical protein
MPARKQPHEFTACEQFGTRYSALGKRIEASVPKGETAVTRTYTSELDIFQLCDNLAVELEDPEAELEYIAQNRKNYYNTHSYMKDKAIGTAYDGPVFPDDIIYRRSSGEKYTVQADGSITTAAGRTYKAPDFQNFIHTVPKKGAAKKEAAPVLTLPKQDNPLVPGECKTRTPEEASRSAAKQREQAKKKGCCCDGPKITDFSPLDEMVVNKCLEKRAQNPNLSDMEIAEELATEAEKNIVREHYQGIEEEAKREVANFLQRRFIRFCEEVAAGRGEDPEVCEFRKYASKEILAYIPHDMLIHELRSRGKDTPSEKLLQAYTDKELADKLRSRGYTVTATKTVEI